MLQRILTSSEGQVRILFFGNGHFWWDPMDQQRSTMKNFIVMVVLEKRQFQNDQETKPL